MTAEWLRALVGGMFIGLGAATLLLFDGHIAGVSGILANAVRADLGVQGWRIAFLAGLIAPAAVVGLGDLQFEHGLPMLAVSGILVGVGSRSALDVPAATGFVVFRMGRLAPSWPLRVSCHGRW